MTATLEEEVRDKRNVEIAEFVMPKPCRGQAVTFYSSGTKDSVGETAFVRDVGRRNLVLHLSSGNCVDTVRHIDDPKLSLSVEQRASGAWDFTDKDKSDIARDKKLAALEARLATLEELLNEPAKVKK